MVNNSHLPRLTNFRSRLSLSNLWGVHKFHDMCGNVKDVVYALIEGHALFFEVMTILDKFSPKVLDIIM